MAHPTSKKFFCSWNDDHRTRASDLIVIGGGLIGLSIAYESAKLGATVTVITGNESVSATLAAAGMLAPQGERLEQGPLLQLCVSSRKLYPAFVEVCMFRTRPAVLLNSVGN